MDNLSRHRDARTLLSARKAGVLSTLSAEAEGYPFGSVVPFCLDRLGRPVVLISDIAQHTKNVAADPRVCLTVLAGGDDVQASARLSLLADAARLDGSPGHLCNFAKGRYRLLPGRTGYPSRP